MNILPGCVFIEAANAVSNTNKYDWQNKITFDFNIQSLDLLIYHLDKNLNNTVFEHTVSSKIFKIDTGMITMMVNGVTPVNFQLTDQTAYSLSSILKTAKLKMYGWL